MQYMKRLKLFFFLVFPVLGISQDFSNTWEGFYSYYQIKDVAYAGGKIYAAAENAVFSYQIGNGTTEKISSIQGLSGGAISEIHYSTSNETLLIGYQNGLIEIMQNDEEEVFSVVDILEKQTIMPDKKVINHFFEFGDKIYISTDYGISTYDLSKLEFGETYFIGDNGAQIKVRQTTVLGERIYAATENGLFFASVDNTNLIDFHQWNRVSTGDWLGVVAFQNRLYATNSNRQLYRLQGNQMLLEYSYSHEIQDLRASENALVLTTSREVHVYDTQLSEIVSVTNIKGENLDLSSAEYFANRVYLGHTNLGLLEVSAFSTSQYTVVSPDGPLMNRIFDMTASPSRLWVVFGEYDNFFVPNALDKRGISFLNAENWTNLPYEDFQMPELSDVAIDPADLNHIFVSSYADGLLEFKNNELVNVYNSSNSNLDEIIGTNKAKVRIEGLAYDKNGNLYMTNSIVENPLKRLTPNGQIQSMDISGGFPDAEEFSTSELAIDNAGNVFFGTNKAGVVAYQPSTGISKTITANMPGVDYPESFAPNPYITALAFDQNNQLWIGTGKGLRVMYGPDGIFQNPPSVTVEPIIFLEGDVAQELLFEQYITDIAVDGKNNKWIATGNTGVFYVSPNGQKLISHFTTESSPLPSNSVMSIEIDEASGKVYMGTTRGLVAFRGTAVQAEETLANVYVYPNPVRPDYNGPVTIAKLTENANVKITDIEGNLVYETTSDGGNVQWDTRAFGRHKVASGVYLVLITSEDQLDTKVSKIMIVR